MKYSGKELYQLYQMKLRQLGCIGDDWEELGDIDRNAWCLLAIELMEDD